MNSNSSVIDIRDAIYLREKYECTALVTYTSKGGNREDVLWFGLEGHQHIMVGYYFVTVTFLHSVFTFIKRCSE